MKLNIEINNYRLLVGGLVLAGLYFFHRQYSSASAPSYPIMDGFPQFLSDSLKNDKHTMIIVVSLISVLAVIYLESRRSGTKNRLHLDLPKPCNSCKEPVREHGSKQKQPAKKERNTKRNNEQKPSEPFTVTQEEEDECVSKRTGSGQNGSITLYYASWCGWSKRIMEHDWPTVFNAANRSKYTGIRFEQICCEGQDKERCKGPHVNGYPTIIFRRPSTDGAEHLMVYSGDRSASDILSQADGFFGLTE